MSSPDRKPYTRHHQCCSLSTATLLSTGLEQRRPSHRLAHLASARRLSQNRGPQRAGPENIARSIESNKRASSHQLPMLGLELLFELLARGTYYAHFFNQLISSCLTDFASSISSPSSVTHRKHNVRECDNLTMFLPPRDLRRPSLRCCNLRLLIVCSRTTVRVFSSRLHLCLAR